MTKRQFFCLDWAKNKLRRSLLLKDKQTLIIYYKLDHLTQPQTIVIIGYRFGYMKNVISADNDKNWRIVLGILRDYPENSVREKIY